MVKKLLSILVTCLSVSTIMMPSVQVKAAPCDLTPHMSPDITLTVLRVQIESYNYDGACGGLGNTMVILRNITQNIYLTGVSTTIGTLPLPVDFPSGIVVFGDVLELQICAVSGFVSGVDICDFNIGYFRFTYPFSGSGSNPPVSFRLTASGNTRLPCADGRINYFNCDKIAIYPVLVENGYDLEIWEVDKKVNPIMALRISAQQMEELTDNPPQVILIEQSEDGLVMVYKHPDGDYQVNYGPDYEGKVFTFRFHGLPPSTYPEVTTFMAIG